jgi:hypothetical protein
MPPTDSHAPTQDAECWESLGHLVHQARLAQDRCNTLLYDHLHRQINAFLETWEREAAVGSPEQLADRLHSRSVTPA